MKKFFCGVIIFAGSSMLTLNSCKKTVTPAAAPTALSTIQGDPTLTVFSAIEKIAGDDNFVNNSTAVLIPVDSAFNSAGLTAAVAATLTQTQADSIVRYYAIPNGVSFSDSANKETNFVTALTAPVYGDSTGTVLYFNGVAALSITPTIVVNPTPTVVGSTSIYKLSQFFNLPLSSITQVTSADTSLTMFNEALNVTNFTSNLSSGAFTLFMPTNAAFMAAGYANVAAIDSANATTLTNLLMYQTVANNYFSNDLATKSTLTTLQGESIGINVTGGYLQLVGNTDASTPGVLQTSSILAGNIVAYKINNVLLP